MSREIQIERLNKRKVLTYLQHNNCVLNPSLKAQISENLLFAFDQIYQNSNGKVLAVNQDGRGNLYHSIAD
jgi:hypothetical protein